MISEMICTGGSCLTTAWRKVMPLNSSAVDIILARALKVDGLERPISYKDFQSLDSIVFRINAR